MTIRIQTPLTEDVVRNFKVGDIVEINGTLFTARDAVHQCLCSGEDEIPVNLNDQIIYHCGPIVRKKNGEWTVKAAGPTTSTREEPYESKLLEELLFELRMQYIEKNK